MNASAVVQNHELCTSVELAISGTEKNLVPPVPAVKLPWRFEQLEKLTDNVVLGGSRNDAYHSRAFNSMQLRAPHGPEAILQRLQG